MTSERKLCYRILVVDDEVDILKTVRSSLSTEGYKIYEAEGARSALRIMRDTKIHLLLTDVRLPDASGLELLDVVQRKYPHVPVIVMTGYASIHNTISAMKRGAIDYLPKPFDAKTVLQAVSNALEIFHIQESDSIKKSKYSGEIIQESPNMKQVMKLVKRVANTSSTVLITGESGVGKELIARKIHSLSARAKQPFVSVNSGALPEGLLESELFGHEKGSFTGAITSRLGRFHIADRGTLFLDEIGNMSPAMQVKLLRVLQENEFSPVGSTEIVSVDVRLVTATNIDLERSVMEGEFREDLFYRLNVIEISVPPLRDRKQDIEPLVEYFLQAFSRKNSTEKKKLTPEVLRYLLNYRWPGNVRELENTIERATVLADGNTIRLDDLPAKIISILKDNTLPSLPEGNINLNTLIDNLERHYLLTALDRCNGIKSKAANYLGLKRTTFLAKLNRYEIYNEEKNMNS